jgi:apolipoprotein N-acyltransferase
VVVEWLRTHLFSGFPWNLAAYSWIDFPGALPLAAWIGPFGVGFLLLLSNSAVALAVRQRRWERAVATLGTVLLLFAMAGRWAAPPAAEISTRESLEVRILQPNIGILTEWDAAAVEAQYQQIFQMSRQACQRPGILLIWPESAAWPYSYSRDERLRQDLERLAAAGCPVLVNTSMTGDGGVFNSVLLIDEVGLQARYDKRHLVPFGEYVPMAGWLPFLDKIARNAGAFLAGTEGGLVSWAGQRLVPAICFEITFPAEIAAQVRRGGSILVTVTNDSWYGDSWAPWQHYRSARFRAAENGRYLLRAAITGVSAVIGPDGSARQQLGVGEEGILAAEVPGITTLTLYSRTPWMVPVLCLIFAAFAILRGRKGTLR